MPYCHVPWTNIDISPKGDISPCCKFLNYRYEYLVSNITRNTIEEYLESPTLKDVKRDFLKDRWPKGCDRCRIEEENNIESRRLSDEKRYKEYLDNHRNNGFISASIAFGNTCNLTCIICDAGSSSRWHDEYKKIYKVDIRPNHFYKDQFVDNFISFSPNLKHLDIPGGEPMLSGVPQQKQLLKYYIDNNKAHDISLHYFTNCTIFPDDEWLSLWQYFKQIEIQLSIDGVGERFEYLRYPGNWLEVEQNAIKYKQLQSTMPNLKLSISTTVSAYNIGYLDEVIDWALENNYDAPWLGRLHNPIHLRCTVWRVDAKRHLLGKLRYGNHKRIYKPFVSYIERDDDSQHFETFRYNLLRHDNYRKLSFAKTFPEMFEFLRDRK